MKFPLRIATALIVVLGVAPARADTIALKNGRHIEGRILAQSSKAVTIEVPGGQMDLPRSQIAEITEKLSVEDEYAIRYRQIAQDDPDALESLALWARAHDMELRARYLEEHAKGVRLEQRFARAKTAHDFLEVATWARAHGFSTDVRRLAATRARELDPELSAALDEIARCDQEDLAAAQAEAEAKQREIEERERALALRERIMAVRERALQEREQSSTRKERDTGRRDEEPKPGTRDGGTPPAGDDGTEPPPPSWGAYYHIPRRRLLRQDDDQDNQQGGRGGGHAAPAPAPAPAPKGPTVNTNPLPSVSQWSPGAHR